MRKLYFLIKERININNDFTQYFGAGIIAAFTEWSVFFSVISLEINYLISVTVAFLIATGVNYYFSRLIFKSSRFDKTKVISLVYFVSFMGLLLNLFFMWILFDILNIYSLFAKIIATGIVFFWNFLLRKYFIFSS